MDRTGHAWKWRNIVMSLLIIVLILGIQVMSKYKIQIIKHVSVDIRSQYVMERSKHIPYDTHIQESIKHRISSSQSRSSKTNIKFPVVQKQQSTDLGHVIKKMHQRPSGKLLCEFQRILLF